VRAAPFLVVVCTAGLASEIRAQEIGVQAPAVELQAGVGYARLFDAGGISFAAAVDRHLSPASKKWQHALGGSLWYAHTGIASAPNDPEGRHVLGLGVRYQLGLLGAKSFRPFLAVPLQLLHSSIPDRTTLQSTSLLLQGVPDPGPSRPVEDHIGGEWGWGTGLELGFRIGVSKDLSAQTSVQALYQDIYESGSRHGAWNWHAGLSYGFKSR
jgi:hypothetical protein